MRSVSTRSPAATSVNLPAALAARAGLGQRRGRGTAAPSRGLERGARPWPTATVSSTRSPKRCVATNCSRCCAAGPGLRFWPCLGSWARRPMSRSREARPTGTRKPSAMRFWRRWNSPNWPTGWQVWPRSTPERPRPRSSWQCCNRASWRARVNRQRPPRACAAPPPPRGLHRVTAISPRCGPRCWTRPTPPRRVWCWKRWRRRARPMPRLRRNSWRCWPCAKVIATGQSRCCAVSKRARRHRRACKNAPHS